MSPLSKLLPLYFISAAFGVKASQGEIDTAFLASVVEDVKQTAGLPSGTAIAVVRDDKLIYRGDFGYRDINKKWPVNKNTRFYIASTTKPLSALNFLLDAQQNPALEKVTFAEMFPSSKLPERKQVTARHLLTHTASINNLPLVLATAYSGEHTLQTRSELVSALSSPSSEMVGEFKYTNVGYNIYSVYADRAFAKPWQQKLQDQVFAPAGMHATTAIRSRINDSSDIAKPYSLPRANNREALYLEKTDTTLHAAGGIYSTSSDMARFLIAQLNEGVLDEKQVFPQEVIARSQTQQATTDKQYGDFKRDSYAWGWYTGDYKDRRMLHHFGGFAGIHSHMSFIPKEKIGLVVLNSEDFLSVRLTGIIADYVYGALLGEEDIKVKVNERVEALKTKLAGLDTMLTKEQNKIAARAWQLSLPASQYTGDYTHPLLGTISVKLNEQRRFDVTWGVMHSNSTGMSKQDQIRVTMDPTSGSVIQFNVADQVTSLTYGGIEFSKTP